jgi:hypothetical protein
MKLSYEYAAELMGRAIVDADGKLDSVGRAEVTWRRGAIVATPDPMPWPGDAHRATWSVSYGRVDRVWTVRRPDGGGYCGTSPRQAHDALTRELDPGQPWS